MLDIAKELGELYRKRADLKNRQDDCIQRREARELELTPPEGWEGKNAETRAAARDAAYASDGELRDRRESLADFGRQDVQAQAHIAALEAERRGLEWIARLYLAERLGDRAEGLPL